MSNKQMTAVELLESSLTEYLKRLYTYEIQQAKKLEKQQIIDAYYYDPNCDKIKDDGEQYYNETYE